MTAGARTRALAARAVERVTGRGETLETAIECAISSSSGPALTDRDRAQVQSLAFGAVRWHHRHRAVLGELLDKPLRPRDGLLEALLSVGLFQLADPDQPDYAAVSASVAASRLLHLERAAGLVNASLRRYQRDQAGIRSRVLCDPEALHSHPAWLLDRLRQDWPERWADIAAANQVHPPLWLRVNRRRTTVADYAERLQAELGLGASTLPGWPDALKLAVPVPASRLPGFADGLVTIQDAASQLAAGLLDPRPGMRVLDACAAPGGKATHLLEHAGGQLDLTAVEISAERLVKVENNLRRLGQSATLVAGDATLPDTWWDGRPFDRILVDAPCSASGVIRRHPDIKLLRRADDLPSLAARQRLLLDRLWPLLAPGGSLLYSTCSVIRAENAGVAGPFAAAQQGARVVREIQLLPGEADTDGFYYALLTPAAG